MELVQERLMYTLKTQTTGRPAHAGTSCPRAAPSPSWGEGRSRTSCGIFSVGELAVIPSRLFICTYQVVEGQLGQISQLVHAQVRKGLGLRVNHLVEVLTLHLIGGHGVPPQSLVKVEGEGLEELLGHVDASALLDDLGVDKLGNLGSRVFLGAVELKGLADGALVVQHALQGASDIDSLETGQLKKFSVNAGQLT